MLHTVRHLLTAVALTAVLAASAAAQQRTGLMGELLKDMEDVRGKLVALAKETPVEKYDWRPGEGVRSIGEVYLHLASDNYLLPVAVGVQPDPSTGIDAKDFSTLTKFEKQKLGRDAMLSAMDKSFAHLRKAMEGTPDARLDEKVKFFGQDMNVRQVWLATALHLHEHLGQSIAYARMNNVTPPWSKKGG